MFSFFRKRRLLFDILASIVFAVGSIMDWYNYFSPEWQKKDLLGGIVYGVMAIIKIIIGQNEIYLQSEMELKVDNPVG